MANTEYDLSKFVPEPEYDVSKFVPDPEKKSGSGLLRQLADVPLGVGAGLADLVNAGVGLGDVATGGVAGDLVNRSGKLADLVHLPAFVRPTQWGNQLRDLYSPEMKTAKENAHQSSVQAKADAKEAGGDWLAQEGAAAGGYLKGAMENPRSALALITENYGGMKAIAQGTAKMLGKTSLELGQAVRAGTMTQEAADAQLANLAGKYSAVGEGVLTTGQNAAQVRAEKPDASPLDYLAQIPAGIITGSIARGVGKIPGLGDAEATMALNSMGQRSALGQGGLLARLGKGFVSEGVLQEVPQGIQEQYWQNLATGKPWYDGMGEQAVQGLIAGGAMGAGAAGLAHGAGRSTPQQAAPQAADMASANAANAASASAMDAYQNPAAFPRQLADNGAINLPNQSLASPPEPGSLADAAATAQATGAPLPSSADRRNIPLRNYPTTDAAQAAIDARPDADLMDIIPHPRADSGYAIVPKSASDIAQIQTQQADTAAKANAKTQAEARTAQIGHEEQASTQEANTRQTITELHRHASAIERSISSATAPGDIAAIQNQASALRAQADALHQAATETQRQQTLQRAQAQATAPADVQQAAQTQALSAEAAQAELAAPAVSTLASSIKPTLPLAPAPSKETPSAQNVPASAAPTAPAQTIDAAAQAANPHPTEAQQQAGNYQKGHLQVSGVDVSIENPVGSTRSGTENGKPWQVTMQDHYGYIKGTVGADGDHVDAYVKPGTPEGHNGPVFVIDQARPTSGQFDEHKVMLGYASQAQAARAYDAHFSDRSGAARRGAVNKLTPDQFKTWLQGDTTKPLAPKRFGGQGAPQSAVEAVHIETDQAKKTLEPATADIIQNSLEKGVEQSPLSLAQMRDHLVGQVDQAIVSAKPRSEYGNEDWFYQNRRAIGITNPLEKAVGYLTFDVPGDGKFKVLNTQENLQKFRSKLATAFTQKKPPSPKNPSMKASPADINRLVNEPLKASKKSGVSDHQSLADDLGNAIEIARLHHVSDTDLLKKYQEVSGQEYGGEAQAAQPQVSDQEAPSFSLNHGDRSVSALTHDELHALAVSINNRVKYKFLIRRFDTLPTAIKEEAQRQGYQSNEVEAVFHHGVVYLVEGNLHAKARAEEAFVQGQAYGVDARLADHLESIRKSVNDGFVAYEQAAKQGALVAGKEGSKTFSQQRITVDGVDRPTTNTEGRPIHYTEAGIRNFWRWIDGLQRERMARTTEPYEKRGRLAQNDRRDSPARYFFDEQGRPRVFYHGTAEDIAAFDLDHPNRKDNGWLGRGVYLSSDEQLSETYANLKGGYDHQVIMPVYAGITNPYVFSVEEKQRISRLSKDSISRMTERAIAHGYDGGVLKFGDGSLEGVAFNPTAVKSVSGNNGDFSPSNPDIRFSRQRSALGPLTTEQEQAAQHVLGTPKTLLQRLQDFKKDWAMNLKQGIFDQFAPIQYLSPHAYWLARLSKGGDSTLEALMMYGKLSLAADGSTQAQYTKAGGLQGFAPQMAKLKGEHDRFLLWVAALRAERLKGIGLENLWSPDDITHLKTLNEGQMADGTYRKMQYAQALHALNAFNDNILELAEQSGLIDAATRQLYKDQPYIPFYRLNEDDQVNGFNIKPGLVNQTAWKKLKGGTDKLNEDLLANLLQNWSHLITASAKNRAAKATLEAAVAMGVAQPIPSGAPGKGHVSYREGGQDKTFILSDPHLMDAVAALHYTGLGDLAKPFTMAKHFLTVGVTANPAFKIRNLIRDSIASIGTSSLSANPARNLKQGWKATAHDSETRAQMMAAGGMIRFGSMLDGKNSQRAKDLIHEGVLPEHILDSGSKIAQFWKKTGRPALDAYNEFGDRLEQVNRAALYEQLIAKGVSPAEAAFQARDLMDFQMSGQWSAVRLLTQTVPFMNARLQGLYKLGRATKEDYRRVGTVVGAVALASLALLLAYQDDKDWKARSEADRNNYWWFKVGGLAYRVPKPFELGAIGTLAERGYEAMFDKEMTPKRLGGVMRDLVMSQLSMNPVPQLIKPLADIYANKDNFSGAPIEGLGMEKLKKADRLTPKTSEVARFLGSLGLPDPAQLAMGRWESLSPVQVDYLAKAYFSWLGTMTTTALDYGIRPMMNRGERPAMTLKDVFLAGNFVESLPAPGSRYVTQMYDQAKEIEQAYASYHHQLKIGDLAGAKETLTQDHDWIVRYPPRQHHGKPTRRPFPATDILRALAFEVLIVTQAGRMLLEKKPYTEADQARLVIAAHRIQSALSAGGINHV